MNKTFVILTIILFVGIFLRFYRLGEIPVGLHRDEAFLGYNAYSILKTGQDMSGNFLPLHLKSFLFSPALYSYFSIPFIALFGLSAFSTRFASAFFGSATVILVFFLSLELFAKYKNRAIISLLSAFFLAISPWHINLSRTATENTIVVFFISLGTLLFLIWLRNRRILFLGASFLFYSLTLVIYQAPRAFLPLFIPMLIIFSFSKIKETRDRFIIIFMFLVLILIPLFFILTSRDLSLRIQTVSVFSTEETKLTLDRYFREDGVDSIPPRIARVFHNKFTGYSQVFLKNYFNHFSYNFLFTDYGFPDRYRIPGMGLLYIYELPFILFGIWELLKTKTRTSLLLIGWILLAPVGSALTFDDVPNLQRTLLIFPALSLIVAAGIGSFYNIIKNIKAKKQLAFAVFALFISYSLSFYLHEYYVHAPVYNPWYRQDGYKTLVAETNISLPNYKKAIITNRESAPAIFFLFFTKYSPAAFQSETKNTTMHDFDRINFAKYEFSQEQCPLKTAIGEDGVAKVIGEKDVLYVNSGLCDVPKDIKILGKVKREDNSLVFTILSFK